MPQRAVMFVVPLFGRGGAETQIMRVSRALRRRGWRVCVVSMLPAVGYHDELAACDVPLYELPGQLGAPGRALGWGLPRLIRQFRPSVLVGFLHRANVVVRPVGLALRVPVVVTSIRSETLGTSRRELSERVWQRLEWDSRVVVNSARVGRRLVRDGIVAADRLEVIGNAIDVDAMRVDDPGERDRVRDELGLSASDFGWLAVTNFRPVKDHPTMLRAFARARNERPQARLRIAGLGRPDAEYERLLDELSLRDAVRFLGERSDIPRLLAGSDAMVLSSRHEGLPNVVMESLAAGRAVVSTDVGGVRELVEPGRTGFVTPPSNPAALGDAMVSMMDLDEAVRERMGIDGRAHVRAHFDIEAVCSRWEALFERELATSSRLPGGRPPRSGQ